MLRTVKNSFYLQNGNGKAGSYRGRYKGDFNVFRSTRQYENYEIDDCRSRGGEP